MNFIRLKIFLPGFKLVEKGEERKPHVLNNLNIFGSGFSINNYTEFMGVSIIKNDMHGKMKRESQYKDDGGLFSYTKYNYRLDEEGNLSPYALAYDYNTNSVAEKMFGITQDVTIDMEESKSVVKNYNTELNLELFFNPFIIPIPTPFFSFFKVTDNYRGATVTKIINQNGLLESADIFHEGSEVKKTYLLLDYYTGQTLLTETQNEFNDNYYTFNYPAYWMYEQMGLAYNSIGFTVEVSGIDGSGIAGMSVSSAEKFTPGDEVLIAANGEYYKRWVNSVSTDQVQIIDANGDPVGPIGQNPKITIVKSGHDNNLTASAGGITLNENPLTESGGQYSLDFNSVINASAVEFSDDAFINCNCRNDSVGAFNEWLAGTKGYWKPYKQYYYMDTRKQSPGNGSTTLRDAHYNTNIREDGVFEGDFLEFWIYNSEAWEKNESGTAGSASFDERWNAGNEVTRYSAKRRRT